MTNDTTEEKIAALMKAFVSPTRIRIMKLLLEGPRLVSELMETVDVERTLLSKHLAVLRRAGMVECDSEWRCRRYHLKRPRLVKTVLTAVNTAVDGGENESD